MAASRSNFDPLEQTINEVLIHVGKTIRAQTKSGRRSIALASAAKINEANNAFNSALDVTEADILRAKATLHRDLELLRARKSAAAVKPEPAAVQQAPPAPMDVDVEEPPSAATKIKSEAQTDAAPSAAMAPFPNMELDSPTLVPKPPPTVTAAVHPPPAKPAKPPTVKKESPVQTMKPSPPAAVAKANKAPIKTAKVPSPVLSRSTASPAATKLPSPTLIRSSVASPIVVKASPRPMTPVPAPVPPVQLAISLSSSSSPILITSPVVTEKAPAASPAVKVPLLSKQVVPAPQPPAPIPAKAPKPITAPPAAPPAAMGTDMDDMNMDAFFDLSGSATAGDHDLGFTDMQFSLVPTGHDDAAHHLPQHVSVPSSAPVQSLPQQPKQQPMQQQQLQPQLQTSQPAFHIPQPPPPPVLDDSEFDVEKFAADAAQNLMMDTAFPSGQVSAPPPQPAPTVQAQTQSQPLFSMGADTKVDGTDNGDDLFKFIDDNADLLGEDPSTNFDDLYMGGTDSIDIDSYFDS